VPQLRLRGFAAALILLVAVSRVPARAQEAAPAPLQPKRDVVTLTNGNRLEGEIKALQKGRPSFDAKATGVISIKWDHVSELTSESVFLVETNEGAQILGTLPAAAPGKLSVQTIANRWTLEIPAVVGIVPIRRSFFQRLDGAINLGGSYTQSSGVAQLSLTFNVKARRPAFEWRAELEDYVTFESNGATTERFRSGLAYSRDITGLWAAFAVGQLERNRDLGFEVRATLAGGIERTLIRTNRSSLVVGAGIGYSREVPVEGNNDSLLPAVLSVRHSFFTYNTPKTSLESSFSALPILDQAGRWRIEASSSVSRELFKDFSIALTFYESYDNRPPSVEASKNDAGATLSIGFTF
jgi:hypothetical protein